MNTTNKEKKRRSDYLKRMDFILECMANTHQGQDDVMMRVAINNRTSRVMFDNNETIAMMNKIEGDGYVKLRGGTFVTAEGFMFIADGGYSREKKLMVFLNTVWLILCRICFCVTSFLVGLWQKSCKKTYKINRSFWKWVYRKESKKFPVIEVGEYRFQFEIDYLYKNRVALHIEANFLPMNYSTAFREAHGVEGFDSTKANKYSANIYIRKMFNPEQVMDAIQKDLIKFLSK